MEYIIKSDQESSFWRLMAHIGFDLCVVCNCIVEFDEGRPVPHNCCE